LRHGKAISASKGRFFDLAQIQVKKKKKLGPLPPWDCKKRDGTVLGGASRLYFPARFCAAFTTLSGGRGGGGGGGRQRRLWRNFGICIGQIALGEAIGSTRFAWGPLVRIRRGGWFKAKLFFPFAGPRRVPSDGICIWPLPWGRGDRKKLVGGMGGRAQRALGSCDSGR